MSLCPPGPVENELPNYRENGIFLQSFKLKVSRVEVYGCYNETAEGCRRARRENVPDLFPALVKAINCLGFRKFFRAAECFAQGFHRVLTVFDIKID
jgi:hypothetical protein